MSKHRIYLDRKGTVLLAENLSRNLNPQWQSVCLDESSSQLLPTAPQELYDIPYVNSHHRSEIGNDLNVIPIIVQINRRPCHEKPKDRVRTLIPITLKYTGNKTTTIVSSEQYPVPKYLFLNICGFNKVKNKVDSAGCSGSWSACSRHWCLYTIRNTPKTRNNWLSSGYIKLYHTSIKGGGFIAIYTRNNISVEKVCRSDRFEWTYWFENIIDELNEYFGEICQDLNYEEPYTDFHTWYYSCTATVK